MAYGGTITPTAPITSTGGYKGITTPVATTPTVATSGYQGIVNPTELENPHGLGLIGAVGVKAVQGAVSGFNAVPTTPKNGQFIGSGFSDAAHATIDAFSSAIKQGSENLSKNVDIMQKQITKKGTLGFEGDVALGNTIVSSIGTVFGAALSPLQGLATVPGVGHAVDFVSKLFGAISEGSGQAAVKVLDEIPMPKEHKDILTPLVHDAASLAGQIAAGKVTDVGIGALKDKVIKVADTLHSQLQVAKTAIDAGTPEQLPKTLPVQGESVETPVEPSNKYTPPEQIPTIQMGVKPKDTLSVAASSPATDSVPSDIQSPLTEGQAKDYVKNNTDSLISKYETKAKQYYNGADNVISADVAKEVLPNYEGKLAGVYHEASSDLANEIYNRRLTDNKGVGNGKVLFTSGGTGVGKSSALKGVGKELSDYSIVYDGNLSGDKAITKIQKALDAGYKVEINTTHRDPVAAFRDGVLPRVKSEGRIVTTNEHMYRHSEVLPTNAKIEKAFANQIAHGEVEITHIDNTGEKGTAKLTSIDKLPKFDYTNLNDHLNAELEKAQSNGTVSPEEAAAIRGEKNSPNTSERIESATPKRKEVRPQKTGEVTKASTDINATIVKQGFDALSPEVQSKYTPESYKDELVKSKELVSSNYEDAVARVAGEKPLGNYEGQILYNEVERVATENGDYETLVKLASSKLGKGLSEAAQTMGAHGFNDNPNSPVDAIREVQRARQAALESKGIDITKESAKVASVFDKEIKSTRAPKQSWSEFAKQIICNI